jgi:hypothetical protein
LTRYKLATVSDWNDLSLGDGTPPVDLARLFLALGQPYGTRTIVTDDHRGLSVSETVVSIFNENGLWASKPVNKNRVGGWARINQMLHNSVKGEGPGIYFDTKCRYLLDTIGEAPRDPLRREDIDHKYACDHGLDALNYLVSELSKLGRSNFSDDAGKVIGAW